MDLLQAISERRREVPIERALLVGISGIDASGKGFVARSVAADLESAGYRVALVNVDAWLNLPRVRFARYDPSCGDGVSSSEPMANDGSHFYHHALRLEEMFESLILPLKRTREVALTMDFAEETATAFRPHTYKFENIDIILLEGIFLFKRQFRRLFDLRIWIDCSFESALKRAVARGQENLPPDATVAAYENIYFPAQRYHFKMDDPVSNSDIIFPNE